VIYADHFAHKFDSTGLGFEFSIFADQKFSKSEVLDRPRPASELTCPQQQWLEWIKERFLIRQLQKQTPAILGEKLLILFGAHAALDRGSRWHNSIR
jgi:hypothetical protein